HDIVFSFKTILDPEIPVRAVRQGTDDIRWVEAYDDYTLVYFHKDSYATNVWNLNFPIIPRHVFEDSIDDDKQLRTHPNHQAYEENPVTGGPYEVVTRQRSQGIRLRRRDSFYMHNGEQVRHKPYFREVIFTVIPEQNTRLLALETGEIDEGELGAEEWRTKTSSARFYANNTKVRDKDWTYFYVGWNQTSPFFEDKKVRQALALVMSHEEMLEDLCYGLFQPSSGIFHPDSWMYPKDPSQPLDRFNKQDLDKADKMLDAAGWDDSDGDGVRDKMVNGRLLQFEFNLIVKNAPDRVAICTLYSEFLDKVSIKCNVRPLEGATLIDRIYEKKFQAVYAGWGSGADPSTNENIFGTGKDRNSGSYSNKEVDRLFDEAMLTHDREERAKLYAKIHELIYEDQPYMFLYTRSSFYGFNKKIRGYKFSPRGPYHYGPGIMSLWGQAD
ncbi:MAG: ABC transporter substrate-binding protein, partial [Pirellulaceae bacterium]|nr:ABC transporter substrate-binding protein [Pirellulaceae bacterium]